MAGEVLAESSYGVAAMTSQWQHGKYEQVADDIKN